MTDCAGGGHRASMRVLFTALVVGLGLTLGCGRGSLILESSGGVSSGSSSGDDTGTGSSGTTGAGTGSGDTPGTDVADATVDGASQPMGGTVFDAGSSLPTGPCGPFNCQDGCCQADGTCFVATAGAVNTPCGSNGEACATCPSGESCLLGACQRDLGETCTPANCAGCCLAASPTGGTTSTQCFDGTQDNACGSGGVQCNRCTPAMNGGHCVADSPSGGHCEDVGQCNASNCAGCCLGNVCAEGQQNVACGIRGAACQDCSDGGTCTGLVAKDGGVDLFCGYDCLSPELPSCGTFCSSPSNCFTSEQFFNPGQ
jgi:hypothetical protein